MLPGWEENPLHFGACDTDMSLMRLETGRSKESDTRLRNTRYLLSAVGIFGMDDK